MYKIAIDLFYNNDKFLFWLDTFIFFPWLVSIVNGSRVLNGCKSIDFDSLAPNFQTDFHL